MILKIKSNILFCYVSVKLYCFNQVEMVRSKVFQDVMKLRGTFVPGSDLSLSSRMSRDCSTSMVNLQSADNGQLMTTDVSVGHQPL